MVYSAVEKAVDALVDFRKQEGAALGKKVPWKIANISHLLETIAPYEKERVAKVKERITDALGKDVGVDYDKNRLEQELIYYIVKTGCERRETASWQSSEIVLSIRWKPEPDKARS